jgi:hypothetical protein
MKFAFKRTRKFLDEDHEVTIKRFSVEYDQSSIEWITITTI